MPDIWMDVDTALSEVPVNLMPLIDDTDFTTIEDAVAYNATGMALRWHFVTTAGAYTVTSVTPTAAGDYDWTDQGDSGIYTIEIPASGGASINNDTEGFGWFSGVATGILPWRGPVIGFRASGLNDLLIDSAFSATRGLAGTALPAAAADAAGGLVVSDAGGFDIDNRCPSATSIGNMNIVFNTDFATNYSTANDQWNVSSSAVASVTGGINTGSGVITTLDALDTAQDTQHGTTRTKVLNYNRLMVRKDSEVATDLSTELGELNANTGTGTGAYDNTTESQEAVRDRGDAAWITATGFSTFNAGSDTVTVGAVGNNAITAAAIADGAIDAATFAADVDAEILSYIVDDATRIDASALNTAATAVGSDGTGLTEAGGTGDQFTELDLASWAGTSVTISSTSGKPEVDVNSIGDDTLAAANLAKSARVIVPGTVDTGSFSATTTEFESDDIVEATADHYIGRVVVFTSGALLNQGSTITDYALSGANGHFTVDTLTEAPGNNDTFIIV